MRQIVMTALIMASLSAMAADPDAIRARAKPLFGTIPAAMPGSEHDTPERIYLGKTLYNETVLSLDNSQSCNTCHKLDGGLGGVDNEPTSLGVKGERGDRNSPTVLNAGFQLSQFWDGRARDLKVQAKGPILNPVEMAMPSAESVINRLSKNPSYAVAFKQAFPQSENAMTYDHLAQAIAAFERTLITRDRFDDFLNGDNKALSEAELRGLQSFMDTGCNACHSGFLLGGNMYQKLGLVKPYKPSDDPGRFNVTGNEADRSVFKVPMLRNIALTAPYFHDGQVATLHEAVRLMAELQLGRKLEDQQVKDIVSFLNALTDKERT